ncbi:unnamed protein product [Calypogeia fissa]
MKATKRIKKLLKDLQTFADGELHAPDCGEEPHRGQESPTHSHDEDTDGNPHEGPAADLAAVETSSSASDTSTESSSNVSRIFRDEVERLVQQLGDSRILVATLMAEINILHQEKSRQDAQQGLVIKRLEEEVVHLQRQAHKDLGLLKARQDQIELDVPILEEQLKSLKDVLHDLNISETLYVELMATSDEKRSVKAHLQILAYQKMNNMKDALESMRKERNTSREALARENDEVEKLKREMHRTMAEVALRKMESGDEMGALKARNERLEAEVRETRLHLEVLKAKGSMYDEVKEKLDKSEQNVMEAESQKAVLTAQLQLVNDEKQQLSSTIKDKDHCLDLLNMDKVYLSREVKAQLDHVKKLEQDLERQQEKTKALRSTKKELYDKVLNDGKDNQAANEQRLQAELSRLREQANTNIEQLRKEATEVADEKVRTFREMRDAALSEAERVQAISRESKSMHDEILSKYQELQRISEARDVKAQSEMKVREFELEQLRMVQQELKCLSNQKSIDNEGLQAKVKVLTERYHTLEMESGQALAHLRSESEIQQVELRILKEKHTRLEELSGKPFEDLKHELEVAKTHVKIYKQRLSMYEKQVVAAHGQAIEHGTHNWEETWKSKKTHAKDEKHSHLKSSQSQTPGSEQLLKRERLEDKAKGKLLKELVQASVKQSKYIEQPQAYLMNVVKEAEKHFNDARLPKIQLESELRKARTTNHHVCNRLQNLQRDLKRILQARGTMENFQRLLREKGIHISDEVIKRITQSKSKSLTPT